MWVKSYLMTHSWHCGYKKCFFFTLCRRYCP